MADFFEILDHTADVKFRVYGKDLSDLFKNIAFAFIHYVCENAREKAVKKHLRFKNKIEDVVFDFVSELVFYFDAYALVCKDLEVKTELKGDELVLDAIIHFYKCEAVKHEVKAMTYSELKVVHNEKQNEYIVEYVLDI